ncbi:ECF RNA polymerase sigma-E factor, partial [Haemophilus influenzae]
MNVISDLELQQIRIQ